MGASLACGFVPWQSAQVVIGVTAASAIPMASSPMDKEMNRFRSNDLFIFPPAPMSDVCSPGLFISASFLMDSSLFVYVRHFDMRLPAV
jgi:hypothetical protein